MVSRRPLRYTALTTRAREHLFRTTQPAWVRRLRIVGLFSVTCLTLPGRVDAHRLNAEAWLEAGGVQVVALYSDDSPASYATIQVFVRAGESLEPDEPDENEGLRSPLFEDKLDAEGRYVFMPPAPSDLVCVIDDGVGHRVEMEIQREHLLSLFKDAGVNAAAPKGPIGVSRPPRARWTRILAGVVAIAVLASLLSLLLRYSRKHAP